MAITETVKIVFEGDTKELRDFTKELENAGKISEETANDFKKIDTEVKKTADSFVPLRKRVKEAKEELQRAEDQFGAFSQEAAIARKRAGELNDQLGDLNRQVSFLNPEDKIKAFNNLAQGVVGAFSVATGALQAFGSENEEVQKIAQKLQGFLNITQGISSIIGLKEAYQDLRIVLGLTTTAQKSLAVANEVEAASAQTAAVANRGLAASLGPIVLIIGALAAAYYLLADSQDDAAKSIEELLEGYNELKKNQELALAIAKEQGASELEQLELRKQNNKLYQDTLANVLNVAKEDKDRKGIQKEINDLKREESLLAVQIQNAIKNATQAELERQQKLREERDKNQQGLKAQFESELQARLSEVDKRTNLVKLVNQIQSKTEKDRIREDLNAELDALQTKRKILIQFGKDTEEIDAQIALNKKIFRDNDLKEEIAAQERRREIALGLAQSSFDFIITLSKNATQKQISDLEQQKEQGIISEEEYQAKLKKIKNDAAKQEKEFAVFAATLAFTEALVKALTTPNPPAALVLAAAVGGLNLAKIIATPVPKFKEGTLNFGGGNMDADGGSLAMLHRGEAVIPADRNRSYHPTLKAIYEKQISPSDINAYVLNRLAGQGSIGRDTVTAKVDTYALSKAMSRNKGVQIENAQIVGKAIASELAGRINRRQMI